MTDKIIISRKEIERIVKQLQAMNVSIAQSTDELRALLDKAEVVRGEPIGELVALPIYNETGIAGWDAEVRLDIYFTFEAGMQGAKVYTTPQPSRIAELEAEVARLKAIIEDIKVIDNVFSRDK